MDLRHVRVAKIGAVHVPVNTRFRVADLDTSSRQSDTATLITHDVSGPVDYLGMARELRPTLGIRRSARAERAAARSSTS